MGLFQFSNKFESELDDWSKEFDLLLREELSIVLIDTTKCSQTVSETFNQDLGGL